MFRTQIDRASVNVTHPLTSSGNRVLTVNGGSSSIKFALFDPGDPPRKVLSGTVDRIGFADSFLRVSGSGRQDIRIPIAAGNSSLAVSSLLDWFEQDGGLTEIGAIGHRVVHGGPNRFAPQLITFELLTDLRKAVPLDPAHLPAEITTIEALRTKLPETPQVACFDTAFHQKLPAIAARLPIPRRYATGGCRRYGFHGLSYTYLLEEISRELGHDKARGKKLILAHLGSGASLAAVRDGRCIDTTMGLTPAGGLVMGTRTGDVDPGMLVYLLRLEEMTAGQLDDLVNRQSGLLGVSETSSDMRDLLARQVSDPRAAEAVELFCYHVRKWIGAYAAALGGLDGLVFAGGIGENAPEVRSRICEGLGFLGVQLDSAANNANERVISVETAAVAVRVIPTNEEIVIARAVYELVGGRSPI